MQPLCIYNFYSHFYLYSLFSLRAQLKLTPLNCASRKGYIKVVRLLLDRGADIEAADNVGIDHFQLAYNILYICNPYIVYFRDICVVVVMQYEEQLYVVKMSIYFLFFFICSFCYLIFLLGLCLFARVDPLPSTAHQHKDVKRSSGSFQIKEPTQRPNTLLW